MTEMIYCSEPFIVYSKLKLQFRISCLRLNWKTE